MRLNMRVELFLVASILCSALGHPSASKDTESAIRSVKSSSGRKAFERESESEVASSVTQIGQDGLDSRTRVSDYEASTASEASYSSSNSETEFVTVDLDNDGDADTTKSRKRAESNSYASASKSKVSKTEFEREVGWDGKNSLDDDLDLEMSYSSTAEKSEKASSAASSSYMSDSKTSIDSDNDNVLAKSSFTSSSSLVEESEFDYEKQEKSFVGKNVRINAEDAAEEKKKLEEQNTRSISSTSQQQNVDSLSGASEITKGSKNLPSSKKSPQSSKGVPKTEKPLKTPQETPTPVESKKPLKPRNSSTQNKKIEETVSASESETMTSNDVTQTTEGINEISSETENDTPDLLGYKSSGLPSVAEKSLTATNLPSTPTVSEKEMTLTAEEAKSLSTEQKSSKTDSTDLVNNLTPNIQIENQTEEQAVSDTKELLQELTDTSVSQTPSTSGMPTPAVPAVPCQSSDLTQIPSHISTPEVPSIVQIPTTPLPSLPQVPLNTQTAPCVPCTQTVPSVPYPQTVPSTTPTAESTVQETSISGETMSSEKQSLETTSQYNSGPGLYPQYPQQDYVNSYPPYPMYSYENSPFLAALDKFPHGQPKYPYVSQPPNMNYFSQPCNFYSGPYVPLTYPLNAYPPYTSNPFHPAPGHPNSPPCQHPGSHPEYPTLPTPQSPPCIPKIPCESTTVVDVPDNLPSTGLPSTLPAELPSPNLVPDLQPRDLQTVDNLPTVPELEQLPPTTLPAVDVISTLPALPQKPLTPSQELMINNHLPPYIIENLEARFEEAKTSILQKYIVYPEDKTEFIATADEQTLIYDYLVLGTHVSGLSALKSLTESGKRVLIVDDARLPPCEAYSLHYRLGLIDSSYVTSYSAVAPKTDVEKQIRVSKVVGGTLSYDLGVWDHGSQQKYTQWSQTCSSWSWETISAYFRDLENVEENSYLNGPINISYNMPECSLAKQIVRAFEEIGIQEERYDLESVRSEPGLILLPAVQDSKTSMTFAEKMFAEVQGRENLHMALGLRAVKIVFESDRAVGVEVVTACGQTRVIRVAEEVIVSYGVVNTVTLLQQSGFGDAALLQQHQIPVVRDLPQLGSDILLYPMYAGVFIRCLRGTLVDEFESDFSALGYAFNDMTQHSSLTTSFYKAFLQVQGASESNIQISIYTFSSRTTERLTYFMKGLFNFNQEMIDFVMEEVSDHDIMFLVPQLLDVEKRAQITISSKDYKAAPIINTHLYESDKDLLMMQKTLSLIRKISKTPVFKEIGGEMVQIPVKKCGSTSSKSFAECSIRELTVAGLHLTGGAAMGVDERLSVVDEQLRLRGTQNVRLLSPAVIPNGVSADSSAISSVVGRYGADMIVKKL